MATIHHAKLTPSRDDLVERWIADQRWYSGRGRPRLRRLDSWRLDDPAGEVGIETVVYLDEGGPEPVVHQVPLTYRGAPLEGAESGLVGETEHSVLGHRWIYDAPHDPVYVDQLLALLRGRAAAQSGSESDTVEPDVVGAPHPAWRHDPRVATSRVLVGEQSNTSVIVTTTAASGPPVILKIFRTLHAGDNPDITLQGALAASHTPFVPATVGHVAGAWQRPEGEGRDYGQVAFAQEYLADAVDGWRLCLRRAEEGTLLRGAHAARGTHSVAPQDGAFADRARKLGRATARVHVDLARVLPTLRPGPEDVADQVARMRHRVGAAIGEVPALAEHEDAIRAVLDAAHSVPWPALQRIHGDYHLGQVLDVPGRGWVLIDFEGEPLRSLAERNELASPLRDVAGILRSLDYVAGAVLAGGDTRTEGVAPAAVTAWRDEAQAAFLDGYAGVGDDPREHEALLRAFVLDKALYEIVYEARHRPTWLHLPTTAVRRLLEEARP